MPHPDRTVEPPVRPALALPAAMRTEEGRVNRNKSETIPTLKRPILRQSLGLVWYYRKYSYVTIMINSN